MNVDGNLLIAVVERVRVSKRPGNFVPQETDQLNGVRTVSDAQAVVRCSENDVLFVARKTESDPLQNGRSVSSYSPSTGGEQVLTKLNP